MCMYRIQKIQYAADRLFFIYIYIYLYLLEITIQAVMPGSGDDTVTFPQN